MSAKYVLLREAFNEILRDSKVGFNPLLVDALLNAVRENEECAEIIDHMNNIIKK